MSETFHLVTEANLEQPDVKEPRLLRQANVQADRFAFSYELHRLRREGSMADTPEAHQTEVERTGRTIKERLFELQSSPSLWNEFWAIAGSQASVIMRGLQPENFVEHMSTHEAIALAGIYNQECKRLEQEYSPKLETYVQAFRESLPGIIRALQLPITVEVAEQRLAGMHFAMADSYMLDGSLASHYSSSDTFLVGFHLNQPEEEFKNSVFHEAFHAISGKYQIQGPDNHFEHMRTGLASRKYQAYGGNNLFETFNALNEALTEEYANTAVGYESTTYLAFRILHAEMLRAGVSKHVLEEAYFAGGAAPEFQSVLPHLIEVIGGDVLVKINDYIAEIQQITDPDKLISEEEYRAKVQAILAGS